MSDFLGREYELGLLNNLLSKKTASLVVVKGRRRIGKSRLIEEFARNHKFYSFSGIPPHQKTTAASEKEVFLKQLQKYFKKVEIEGNDWWDMLWFLSEKTKTGRIIVLFDEISWMGSQDLDFLGKLKTVWDTCFKKNGGLIFVLCGSVSIWIKKNILSNTGFVGRISLQLTLTELPLSICNKFFNERSNQLSAYEKFKFLSVTGGIPRYLEEWKSNISIENNINQMCFHSSGILFNEFDQIFNDSLSSDSKIYRVIVEVLISGPMERQAIAKKVMRAPDGTFTEYLDNLIISGFIARDFTWDIKNKNISKLSYYRLSDNYIRFYLKYIRPQYDIIKSKKYRIDSLSNLPGWASIIALQFENLVLLSRDAVQKILGISSDDIEMDNPFFQRKTKRIKGCQIDYLIQTKTSTLYACEIKFSRSEIKSDIISEMQQKLSSLVLPRGFSCLPVLIHVNGVHDNVIDSNYFFKIIDFSGLLR